MLINVLCSSTHPKGHTHSPGSYSEIVWSKAAVLLINPELHQSCLKNVISEAKSLILFPLDSFLCPVKFCCAAQHQQFHCMNLDCVCVCNS